MLDDVHESLPRNPDDTNSYVLGSIKRRNIVISCLPAGQYGIVNAATVATNLKRTFPKILMTLMVGIGGGVPSKGDIRLGDVVVGTRIMQYDLGKIVADGKFERTAVPKVQSPLLGTALNHLRAKHELNASRIPSILQQKLERYIDQRLYPGVYDPPGTIKIHYGAIASGNQVMKHGITRDNVARELDIICFEMEAAGTMDIIPCLPVRGICDYSDSHKNEEWQRYAAATAAAYARELIEELPVIQEQPVVAYLTSPDRNRPENRRQLLMKSLGFKQMDSRRININDNYKKTCQWLLNHPGYKAWLDSTRFIQHHGFLWISGKPGAGKSTIMKFAYSNMKRACRADVKTASFFNARGGSLERSTSGMYRSLLLQLLEEYRDLQTVLDNPDILPQNQEDCPPLNILKDLFRDAISVLGQRRFTCFVDALDECDEQQVMDMVEFFEDLGEQAKDHNIQFRICFSSRHYPYVVLKHGIRFTLEDQPGHAEDLAIYITNRLRINDQSLIEDLLPELLRKAAGVFILAEIPSDLSKLFKDLLTRDTKDMDSLLLCIRWILFAERPLQPEEFRHALWSGLSLSKLVDSQIPAATRDKNSLDKVVISYSKGLAEITKSQHPTVQFIHESVRDFLLKDNGLHELWPGMETDWEISSHENLKQCCISYLNQPSVSTSIESLPPGPNSNARENISTKFPFLKYATQSILYHANAAAEVVVQNEFLSEFPIVSWIKMNNHFEKHTIREYTLAASLLYILADKGYPNLVRTWLKDHSQWQIPIHRERYRYPLFAALASGNNETVAALLNTASSMMNGTDITEGLKNRKDLKEYKNRTPLSWAAQEGRLDIVTLLLETGLVIDESDGGGRTGLSRAAENGHEAVAKLLIEKGANINISDGSRSTALHHALQNRHEAMARLLIEKGADINIIDESRSTALHYALGNGYEAVARLLIEKGADVNMSDESRSTALHHASQNGYEAVVRLLSERS
ncbi:hypothetical protein EYB26_009284 [Talaromyces marneffei]|uniref:Putative ankyrin repeat protein n=1 Tax=Talaromyces marneffei PM1 TaxID=1077442 RepID=A0A093VRC1_TALMA|nr:uncharacterized protein EYB26_009284 [Talaromyces marneffei]QGA21573.1 hypothetical protein EYB26_009284 [Talaromyces marneffei]